MIDQPLIYIIILNWNGWQDTIKCLESLQKLEYSNYQVLVIDNGSTNNSLEQIEKWAINSYKFLESVYSKPIMLLMGDKIEFDCSISTLDKKLLLISNKENLGFSGGCNLGITYALKENADYIFLLNNDAYTNPDILNKLVLVAQKAKAAIVGARVMDESGNKTLFAASVWPAQLFFSSILTSFDQNQEFWGSPDAQGCALLAHKSVLEQRVLEYGYFLNPELFMYKEETDFCIYALKHNHRCVIARDAVIYHGLAKSSGGSGNFRSYYYLTRNRIYLANRWLNFPWKVFFHIYYAPSRVALALLNLMRRRWTVKVAKAVITGLSDGYQGIKGKWKHH